MISLSIHDLRTEDWRQIDRRELRERVRDCDGNQVVRWHLHENCRARCYLVLTTDGGIYLVRFRRMA